MMDWLLSYRPLADLLLINCGLAYGQYIVLRTGAFSVASAGLACLGAYTAAIMVRDTACGAALALSGALAIGLLTAVVLALPLARVRGVYQAIATLAFVQVVMSVALYAEDLTGGPMGLNAIPKLVTTPHLIVALGVVIYVMQAVDRSRFGAAFDAVRQDEVVAATLGVAIPPLNILAFALSGAVTGLFGGLTALHSYSLDPAQFGFPLLVSILAMVVLGGRRSIWGPLVGAAILTTLPEVARPLSDNRALVNGLLLIGMIVFLPRGIVDTLSRRFRPAARLELDRDVAST